MVGITGLLVNWDREGDRHCQSGSLSFYLLKANIQGGQGRLKTKLLLVMKTTNVVIGGWEKDDSRSYRSAL